MKIVIVNTYDVWGAAKSCLRLHVALHTKGIESNVILRHKQKNIKNTHELMPFIKATSILVRLKNKFKRVLREFKLLKTKKVSKNDLFLRNRSNCLESFSFPYSNYDITKSEFYKQASIVNLHWVANFLDYKSFFEKNTKPVVWTLHDMNPFTGGEHYEEKYLGIDELGYPVLRKKTQEEIDVSRENLELKHQIIKKVKNLTIVAPSKWLVKEAEESEVFKGRDIFYIPYGLDSELFKPRDKTYSREILNIPLNKRVILFVADSIDNNRKGYVFLKKAFEQLSDSNIVLCAIGDRGKELNSLEGIIELGTIHDERLMSIAYSAADVFVMPSLMDNLPNTVIESLMCGTPVIGFPVGGIIDMIQDGENGFITKEISVNSLSDSLKKFLKSEVKFNRDSIRMNAMEIYNQDIQASKYIDLFQRVLK